MAVEFTKVPTSTIHTILQSQKQTDYSSRSHVKREATRYYRPGTFKPRPNTVRQILEKKIAILECFYFILSEGIHGCF